MTPPTLRTPRLLLEPYVRTDEEAFVALVGDPRVSRWLGQGPQTQAADRALFARVFTDVYPTHRFDVWAVRRGRALVGHAELKPATVVDGFELIYALAASHWGQGLGTELAEAICAHGFNTLGLDRVHATVDADNAASLRVLGRIDFTHVRDIVEDNGALTRLLTRHAPTEPAKGHRP